MCDWISLNLAEFSGATAADLRTQGVGAIGEIHVVLSPHDVPIAARCIDDDKHKHVVIEFKYLDSEKTKMIKAGADVRVEIGKHSNRLHAIQIPWSLLDTDGDGEIDINARLASTVEPGLGRLREAHPRWSRNIDVVKKVMESQNDALLTGC